MGYPLPRARAPMETSSLVRRALEGSDVRDLPRWAGGRSSAERWVLHDARVEGHVSEELAALLTVAERLWGRR